MRITILETAQPSDSGLDDLLCQYFGKKAIINWQYNGREAIHSLNQTPPDILFLEDKIDGISAFDVLDQVRNLDFPFVVFSRDEDVALTTYRYGGQGFLLKPVKESELFRTLQRLGLRSLPC